MPNKIELPQVSEQARSSCGELQAYQTGTKAEILSVASDTAYKFHDCKAKHKTVVEEYRNLESLIDEFNKGL